MRKSSLVKAMACFMAATMAVTCVPGVNVTNGVVVVAEAAVGDTGIVTGTTNESEEIANGGFWASCSPYYQLTGDFHIKFDVNLEDVLPTLNYDTPSFVFTNNVKRNDDDAGYKEYRVIRSDAYAWKGGANTLNDPTLVNFETSWGDDWDTFRETMKGATATYDVVRTGDDFELTADIKGGNGKKLTYKASFTEPGAEDTIRFFMTSENMGVTINSFANFADYISDDTKNWINDGSIYLDDDVYTIDPVKVASDGAVSLSSDDKKTYNVNLSRFFNSTRKIEEATFNPEKDDVKTVDLTINGVKQTLKYKVVPPVPCNSIKVLSGEGSGCSLHNSFDVTVEVSNTTKGGIVTDSFETAAPGATVSAPKRDADNKNKYTFTITPTELPSSNPNVLTISCGSLGAVAKVNFNVYGNKCTRLTCSKGEAKVNNTVSFISKKEGQIDTFDITAYGDTNAKGEALSADGIPEIVIDEEKSTINIKDVTVATGASIKNPLPSGTNAKRAQIIFKVPSEEKVIVFQCGDCDPLEVKIQPDNTTGNGSSATNPSTPGTTTPGTDTPDADEPDTTTPGAVEPGTDTPGTTTPDTDTPGTTTPGTTDTDTSDTDNNNDTKTKTTKKKAKVASVTAKKGKKVVSGTVKISATGKKVSKATVKVYVNSKKKVTVKTKSTGKFTAKLSKKLKKGDKVKLVITKSNIKKITKTVKVK